MEESMRFAKKISYKAHFCKRLSEELLDQAYKSTELVLFVALILASSKKP